MADSAVQIEDEALRALRQDSHLVTQQEVQEVAAVEAAAAAAVGDDNDNDNDDDDDDDMLITEDDNGSVVATTDDTDSQACGTVSTTDSTGIGHFAVTCGINLVLPFLNGMMLGFGELVAHELGFRYGWLGAKVYPPQRRLAAERPLGAASAQPAQPQLPPKRSSNYL